MAQTGKAAMFSPMLAPALLSRFEFYFEKINRLEKELDAAVSLLQILAERTRRTLGAEALGPELCRFLTVFDESEQREIVARLDSLADSGAEPEAVRLIRSLTGETWDQALSTYVVWRNFSKDDKARWARVVLLQKAVHPQDSAEEGK
jgi:hypothetical protein